jgi:hypothetical protein
VDGENRLRHYARAAQELLPLMMVEAQATPVRRRIEEALGLPDGTAFSALTAALRSDPILRELIAQQRQPTQYRAPDHHLDVEAQRQVHPGREFSVFVAVTGPPLGQDTSLRPADSSSGELVVSLYAPGFMPTSDSDWRQRVPLPSGDGPSRIEFGLRGANVGDAQEISVRVFAGGAQVGQVSIAVDVRAGAATDEHLRVATGLSPLVADPRDALLEVRRVADKLEMRLSRMNTKGDAVLTGPVDDDALRWLIDELRVLAKGKGGPAERTIRLRDLGVELWSELFPADIREQLSSLPSEVTSLHVLSEGFALPFELIHPYGGGNDAFLVERFDVARLAGGRTAARRGTARQAALVRPVNRPTNVDEEFRRITDAVGRGTRVWQPVTTPQQMNALLTLPTTLIHIAARLEKNLALRFDSGRFDHRSLSSAILERSLASVAPVVLFNGCGTATEVDGIVEPTDWGRRFIQAGAGVFVGTLWPVKSGAAATFAEAFHGSLAIPGSTVGQAMRSGRTAVRDSDGDAAWLAYTLYGDPRFGA